MNARKAARKGSAYRFQLDGQELRRHAKEITRQVGFYERNGKGDEIRFLHIETEARWLLKAAQRAAKRYDPA